MDVTSLLQSLRRIEGQVGGLQRMIEGQRPCDEVLTQVMAVHAALDRVTADLVQKSLVTYMQECSAEEALAKVSHTVAILCRM